MAVLLYKFLREVSTSSMANMLCGNEPKRSTRASWLSGICHWLHFPIFPWDYFTVFEHFAMGVWSSIFLSSVCIRSFVGYLWHNQEPLGISVDKMIILTSEWAESLFCWDQVRDAIQYLVWRMPVHDCQGCTFQCWEEASWQLLFNQGAISIVCICSLYAITIVSIWWLIIWKNGVVLHIDEKKGVFWGSFDPPFFWSMCKGQCHQRGINMEQGLHHLCRCSWVCDSVSWDKAACYLHPTILGGLTIIIVQPSHAMRLEGCYWRDTVNE